MLQPYNVFKAEVVRVNSLYWTTQFCHDRVKSIYSMLATTGVNGADPLVEQIWGAQPLGLRRESTNQLSVFFKTLDTNSNSLRATSILHLCSAFENALCGYFILCALYDGGKLKPSLARNIPDLMRDRSAYTAKKKAVIKLSSEKLKGKYADRVKLISNTWGIPQVAIPSISRLNSYYRNRHLIAHDQGIVGADSPDHSAAETVARSLNVDELSWKKMIEDFSLTLESLDDLILNNVITNKGLHLAVYRVAERDGPLLVSQMCKTIREEWRFGSVHRRKVKICISSMGLTVKGNAADDFTVSL